MAQMLRIVFFVFALTSEFRAAAISTVCSKNTNRFTLGQRQFVFCKGRGENTTISVPTCITNADTVPTNNLQQWSPELRTYVVGSKSFRPDQLFKVTEIKQFCYFST